MLIPLGTELEQTFQKPKAKPRGSPQNVREKMARLDILAHKALRFWETTLDDKSEATTAEKIQVSKLVVEYAWGKPKQQVQVEGKLEITQKAHIDALVMLAQAAHGPLIDANSLVVQDNPTPGPNVSLLAAPVEQPVSPGGGLAVGLDVTGQRPEPAPGAPPAGTPRPGLGPPGGGIVMEHPHPLDTKND